MNKIGIILRENKDKLTLKKEISDLIIKYNCVPIGIVSDKIDFDLIKICSGFILQGGTNCNENDLKIVRYLYKNNIPTLGICLGMQMMGLIKDGILLDIGNNKHKSTKKYVHEININKDSKLYQIIKKEKIPVNSRHIEQIIEPKLNISSYSLDNIIESIEDENKTFFIGVQWHPESLIDENSKKLFDYFFNIINKEI